MPARMADDLDDYELERTPARGRAAAADEPPAEPPRLRAPVGLLLGALFTAVALAGGVAWLLLRPRPVSPRAPRVEAPSAAPVEPAAPEPPPALPSLPPLEQSDALVREMVQGLSAHPQMGAWLEKAGLVRRYTAATANIADGENPSSHLPASLGPREPFRASAAGARFVMDPRGYSRFDAVGDSVAAVDARGLARIYRLLKPLVRQAFRELGYPPHALDATVERALVALLEAPVVDGEIALVAAPPFFRFADPSLEALAPAQKQLLRMGPRNTRLVQAKLRELARALGISEERLPRGDAPPAGQS